MATSRKDARKTERQQKAQRKAQFYTRTRAPPAAKAKRTTQATFKQTQKIKDTHTAPKSSKSLNTAAFRASDDESICSDDLSVKEDVPFIRSEKIIKEKKHSKTLHKDHHASGDVLSDPLLAYAERAIEEGILGSDGEFDETLMDGLFGESGSDIDSGSDEGHDSGMDIYGRESGSFAKSTMPVAINNAPVPDARPHAAETAPHTGSQRDEHSLAHRQIRGLLNRLALANVEGIAASMTKLTDEHPRGVVSEALSAAVLDSLTRGTRLHASFVLAHAVLVAALAHTLGVDVAGRVIEESVSRIDSDRQRVSLLSVDNNSSHKSGGGDADINEDEEDMSPLALATRAQRHVLTLLAYLHALRVVGPGVVVGLAREAAARVALNAEAAPFAAESDASLVVAVLQLCVAQLKREDPAALRTLLLDISTQLSTVSQPSARMRFLADAIEDVRNNRQRIVPGSPPADVESARKTLRAVLHSRGCARLEPLAVTLADIRGAASRGKWWITGAAWRPDAESAVAAPESSSDSKPESSSTKLDALARAQGMSTEVRRAVFCALMSSEDYSDAHQRLLALRLGSRDEREIAHVLLHCTASESRYNPFYALVALRFLAQQHNFVVTFRYALWDRLRALDEGSLAEPHVARFFGALLGHKMLPISVLKRVSLAQVSGETLVFLRTLIAAMLEAAAKPTLDSDGLPIDSSSPQASTDATDRLAAVLAEIFRTQRSRAKAAASSQKSRRRVRDFEDALAGSVMLGASDSESGADSDADPEEQRAQLLRRQEMDALRTGLRLFARMHMSGSMEGVPTRVAAAASPLLPVLIEMLDCVE